MADQTVLASFAAMLDVAQISAEELAEFVRSGAANADATSPTLREFWGVMAPVLNEGTRRGYQTHINRLIDGVARQCACTCARCVAEFDEHGCCECTCSQCKTAIAVPAMGDLALTDRNFNRSAVEPLVSVAQRMAAKKALAENQRRAKRGLAPKHTHGQGGREMAVAALRCVFERAVDDGFMTKNAAAKIAKGSRSESSRRAINADELVEFFEATVAGGDDPELDLAIAWGLFETAGRRAGLLALTVGGADLRTQQLVMSEKFGVQRTQPVSAELLGYMLGHAIERGGARCDPTSPCYDPTAPMLYYLDSTPERPHPLTSRRFDTFYGRIQKTLPWAAESMFTAHSLRHTTATMVERISSSQVARKYLGHGKRKTTDIYTDATQEELTAAFSAVTGFAHPGAAPALGHQHP